MKYLKKYKVFESSDKEETDEELAKRLKEEEEERLKDIKKYIDDILLPLEETNFVMVRDFTKFVNIDPSKPDVKVDVNHIKIDISADIDISTFGHDDFELTEDNLSDIKSLYNYMSEIWTLKFFKVKYYYPKQEGGTDFGTTSIDIKSMEEFEDWYNKDFVNGRNLLTDIIFLFSEYSYTQII